MPEMEPLFRQMVNILSQARQAVQDELEPIAKVQAVDGERLASLSKSVADFSQQADSLLVMMLERSVDDDLMKAAEELVDFFQDAERRIEGLLPAKRG